MLKALRREAFIGSAMLVLATVAGCSGEPFSPKTLMLEVSSEELIGDGSLDGLRILATDGARWFPPLGAVDKADFGLDETKDPVRSPVYVAVDYLGTTFSSNTVEATVVGLRDRAAAAIWGGQIDLSEKRIVKVMLRAVGPGCDGDKDGFVDCAVSGCCDGDAVPSDCEPDHADANPWGVEPQCEPCDDVIDQDCRDGDRPCVDGDGDGIADCIEVEEGCGVGDPLVGSGLPELCDGIDNDCDSDIDEGLVSEGGIALGGSCGQPDTACGVGVVVCDTDPAASPVCSTDKFAVPEVCDDGIDDDCNGIPDDGCLAGDVDGDGYLGDVDCNDHDTAYHPDASEPCCDYALSAGWDPAAPSEDVLAQCDYDCDGTVTFCSGADLDGDGVETPADCDDTDPWVFPGAPEKCDDGIDQDCFGGDAPCSLIADADGDGYPDAVDCDDESTDTYPSAPELCDGADNDCDGIVDEGNPGGGEACGSSVGVCKPGTWVCQNTADTAAVNCVGGYAGTAESCDGIDNDCDGAIDNGVTYNGAPVGAACDGVGACGQGLVECNTSKQATCSSNPDGSQSAATPELCDNIDNDCDGEVDDGLAVAASDCLKQGVCADAIGAIVATCAAGTWTCDYSAVPGYEGPTETSCDGLDNDCDGFPDDDFGIGQGCDGPDPDECAGGKLVCAPAGSPTPTVCQDNGNSAEVCDGLDNDCDGDTDEDFEDLGEACDGPDSDQCANGVRVCSPNFQGTVCGPEVGIPLVELCNGADDDCDGQTDEVFPLLGFACDGDDADSCTHGTFTCTTDGKDVECVNEVGGVEVEFCNGVDDDCDGLTDEDADASLGQPCDGDDADECEDGILACPPDGNNTNLICTGEGGDAVETCNGVDDDCDGVIDEDVLPGDGTDGGCSEEGICQGEAGVIVATCDVGGTGTWTCDYSAVPDYEGPTETSCDGLDNDCDGVTDDGFSDQDVDGEADCVDTDIDGDGVDNEGDNCAEIYNPGQENLDGDAFGNLCDDDVDGDEILDDNGAPCTGGATEGCSDNCPLVANPQQEDTDNGGAGDGVGDVCEISCTPDEATCAADGRTLQVCNADGDGIVESLCDFICHNAQCYLPTTTDAQIHIAACDGSAPALNVAKDDTVFVTDTELLHCPNKDCGAASISIAPVQFSTDVDTPMVFCLSSLTLGDTTLVPSPGSPPPGPVIFLVDGDVNLQGELLFEGGTPAGADGGVAAPGGWPGGDRPADEQNGPDGLGPGAGSGGGGGGLESGKFEAGGGGGGAFNGNGGDGGSGQDGAGGSGGIAYGGADIIPLRGGSGGGAGGAGGTEDAGAGGGGAGAVQIVCRNTVTVSGGGGKIKSKGGKGGAGNKWGGGGGGGAGGAILIDARAMACGDGKLEVKGGDGGGAGAGGGGKGGDGDLDGQPGVSNATKDKAGSGGGGGAGWVRLNFPWDEAAGGPGGDCKWSKPTEACSKAELPQQP